MGIELKKPFSSYIAFEELPRTGDARKFVAIFPFQVEGTNQMQDRRMEMRYSGTQEAIDEKKGVDGLTPRKKQIIEQLERVVADEIKANGDRLYESGDTRFPIWGKKK